MGMGIGIRGLTIGDSGDELDTTYYSDGIHCTRAGYAIVA